MDDTTTLWVRGLDGEGPGDIVGAFCGESGIDADALGAIDLQDGEAFVEVSADLAAAMDGHRVGTSTVQVSRFDDDAQATRDYVRRLADLVEMEREEEMRRHEREMNTLTGRERENKGRALLRMRRRKKGEGLCGHFVKFLKADKGTDLPDTEISTGDLVMISKDDPLRDDNPTGTVTQVTGYSVTVAFDDAPSGWMTGDDLRVDLYVNDVTYQRMNDALARLVDADDDLARLRDVCTGVATPSQNAPEEVARWHNDALNASQKQAVRESLATGDVHLIHGPPGTGKTTTAIEVVEQSVSRGDSVLATAASNTAVDTMLEFLVSRGVDAVRLGHPARVTPVLHGHTLDARIQDYDTYQKAQRVREEAFDLLDAREDLTTPSGRYRRGMSDEKIKELAQKGTGARGVSPDRIVEMAEWIKLREQADRLFNEAESLEDEAVGELLDAVDVVCTTNATAGSDLLGGRTFDTLVIDEATQATAPSCWIPMVHARRVILAGDHRQLPPTIQNEEAARSGLRETLFERLARHHPTDPDDPNSIRSLLRVQYRMHEAIMGFSSQTFYDGMLEADTTVCDHTLAGLGVALGDASDRQVLDPNAPLVYVDTQAIDAPEMQRAGSTSRENPAEADLVARFARGLLRAGVAPSDLAVITPYADQVRRIAADLSAAVDEGLEVDSVDGFQGREKEAVVVSLVRSNPHGDLGFLDEPRRFNVSLTRARRKAIIVGDCTTIRHGDVFHRFIDYAETNARIVEA